MRVLNVTVSVVLGVSAAFIGGCASAEEGTQAEPGKPLPPAECCPGGNGHIAGGINTAAHEYAPFVDHSPLGDVLWFTSGRPVAGKKSTDLPAEPFFAPLGPPAGGGCPALRLNTAHRMPGTERDFDRWTKGAAAVHGNEMILAVEQPIGRASLAAPTATSYNLYLWRLSRRADGAFGNALPLDEVNLSGAWTSQPALSTGGDTLLFVSNRPNPHDPADTSINIWFAARDDSVWSAPRMIERLSSPGHDVSPSIDARGNVYFASNWDYRAGAPSRNGYDLWYAGKLDSVLGDAEVRVVNMDQLTSVPGCMGGEAFTVNTPADEMFPHLADGASGPTLYYASNRPGGAGGFDLYACAMPAPCVRIMPVVECYEGGAVHVEGVSGRGRPMADQPLRVIVNGVPRDTRSGDVLTVRAGDRVRVERDDVRGECLTMTCRPAELDVPFVADSVLPVPVYCDCNRIPLETIVISDVSGVPYFVTGYWWPNTAENYRAFQSKHSAGRLRESRFINPGDYDYRCASEHVDQFFDRNVYEKIDQALERMSPCAGELALMITVIGYTDACGLAPGSFSGDGDVRLRNASIAEGTNMQSRSLPGPDGIGTVDLPDDGQRGNVILSKLRAHFTWRTIDRDMEARSERYRTLKQGSRILFDTDGFGIYENKRWRNAPPVSGQMMRADCGKPGKGALLACNDPESRRIEIYLTVVPASDSAALVRPPATDVVEAELPEPGTRPRTCDCYRVEHPFKTAEDAAFTRSVIERLAGETAARDSITIEKRPGPDGRTLHVLRTGCMESQPRAEEAGRFLRAVTGQAAGIIGAYAPAVTTNCAFHSIGMGTLRHLRNADALRDTLKALTDGRYRIEQMRTASGEMVYRVREGWYRTEKEAQERLEGFRAVLTRAGIVVPMKTVQAVEAIPPSFNSR